MVQVACTDTTVGGLARCHPLVQHDIVIICAEHVQRSSPAVSHLTLPLLPPLPKHQCKRHHRLHQCSRSSLHPQPIQAHLTHRQNTGPEHHNAVVATPSFSVSWLHYLLPLHSPDEDARERQQPLLSPFPALSAGRKFT